MEVKIKEITSMSYVKEMAMRTIDKKMVNEPDEKWVQRMLLAEHSPIRVWFFEIHLIDIKSWVSTHFVRHKIGVEHFVKTQREDRTGEDRDSKRQDALVNHTMVLNAQSIINISRDRLCGEAHKETVEVWKAVVNKLPKVLKDVCVPDCVYRGGFCHKMKSCGYNNNSNMGLNNNNTKSMFNMQDMGGKA